MLQSWHNFFFVAAEPGGSVSIDKPPLGLWLQVISAYIFGVNGFGVLLPQILAGILSVIVLYHLVRRWFGMRAGLLAALALAITPVVVATDRNNTMDSTLILTLLLAAWAFIRATEGGKLRHLLLGAALVGIGFNIKMLQAFLPLPAFYALYLLGAKAGLGRKLANLALASLLLLIVSLSWAVIVDLIPADRRPYVGSSGNNSVLNFMLGYNGVERLTGMGGRGGFLNGLFGGDGDGMNRGFPQRDVAGAPGSGANSIFPQQDTNGANDGFPQPGSGGTDGRLPRPGANGGFPGSGPGPQGGFRSGLGGTGQAGPLRLFTPPLAKEVSWLLPFGLFSAVLLAFRTRLRWPLAQYGRAMLLWGGWLLTGGVFFSVAGFFHEYYLSLLAPPLAALVVIGAVELWRIREEQPWLAIG
ncbi:MAG: glycosyltransferase family 39 protein, partial [Anaerolineae bacterium]